MRDHTIPIGFSPMYGRYHVEDSKVKKDVMR